MPLRFEKMDFSLSVSGKALTFVRPKNPDEVLDDCTEEEFRRDSQLPYWADFWPSSEITAPFAASLAVPSAARVLEIGAGLGVVSAAFAHAHPHACTIVSDLNFDAALYISENCTLNRLNASVLCFDWRHSPFKEQFDIIIGCDILYEERWIDTVLAYIKENLRTQGRAYVSDPGRKHWPLFKQKSINAGFLYRTAAQGVPQNNGLIEIIELFFP